MHKAWLTGMGRFLMKCTNETVTIELKTGQLHNHTRPVVAPPY